MRGFFVGALQGRFRIQAQVQARVLGPEIG